MSAPLRPIPLWLITASAALFAGALVRTTTTGGVAGVYALLRLLVPPAIVMFCLLTVHARLSIGAPTWPGPKLLRRLTLTLVIVVDCYFLVILVLGAKFLGLIHAADI